MTKTPQHGIDCRKARHTSDNKGFLHHPERNAPFVVDGIEYCGRCHAPMWTPIRIEDDPAYDTTIDPAMLDLVDCLDALEEKLRARTGQPNAVGVSMFHKDDCFYLAVKIDKRTTNPSGLAEMVIDALGQNNSHMRWAPRPKL